VLYGYGKPVFVVDAYTARVFVRHGMVEPEAGYFGIQEFFESSLGEDTELFNEFHALIVCVGKEHCKKRPKCSGCPLEGLPHEIEQIW
jgi:endonuclease-3 related protein